MSDIFISYSSKDKEKADQLSELLVSAGLSVWIDQSGIDVATSWSKEIVQAIDGCKALVVLLSPNSVISMNVAKEVSLAAEQKKKILPLDLEPVELTDDLRYHLAGIQRAPMTNIDAIIRALGKFGLEATQAPTLKIVKEVDSRKSLMILPFEDMSPTGDNGWFADGLAAELISALSNVKSLRVSDQQATKDYKRYQGTLPKYAVEMSIRYFIQGSVRKFGDQIKITSSLLDIETGDHLWQDSMKGTMNDIFDIQEKVAEKVVEGLKIHLASDEKKKLAERGTENAEAYELFLKANEYLHRMTREGLRLGIQQLNLAIELDPLYANALAAKAFALAEWYRAYEPDPKFLIEAELNALRALEIQPNLWKVYDALSSIYYGQGKLKEAEDAAKKYVFHAPEFYHSYFSLAFFYSMTEHYAQAIETYEKSIELNSNNLVSYWNIISSAHQIHDSNCEEKWSFLALPHFERKLRLVPDDEMTRVWYASILRIVGKHQEAIEALSPLLEKQDLDAVSLYNIAALYAGMNDMAKAHIIFRKAIEAGFRNTLTLKDFLNDEYEGIAKLKGTPEYEEVRRMVEKIEAEANANV